MSRIDDATLFAAADRVRARAHAPYSGFHVGAAILDDQGGMHVGCNVENAAYPLGACAEANAIARMIAEGGRQIVRIAIIGGPAGEATIFCAPCGGCRQRIREFADADTQILLRHGDGRIESFDMSTLLPHSFHRGDLPQ